MSLICTANRIRVTDSVDDRVAFDTDRAMFHTLDFLDDSISLAARSNLDTSQDIDQSTKLADVNSACTHVFGWCRPTFASSQDSGVVDGAWHAVGGTIMLFMSPGDKISGQYRFTETASALFLTHAYALTFRVTSGEVFLDEQIFFMRINSGDATGGDVIGCEAFDLEYKLWVGAFDN